MKTINNTRVYDAEEAFLLGLNNALFIGQVRYWLGKSEHVKYGKKWVYNTYESWQEQFPFWSISTIKRLVKELAACGILETGHFNQKGYDKTNWYTLDEHKISEIMRAERLKKGKVSNCTNGEFQNDTMEVSNCTNGKYQNSTMESVKMTRPIPEITSEITSEITDIDYQRVDNTSYQSYDVPTLLNQLNRIKNELIIRDRRNREIQNCTDIIIYYMEAYKKYTGKTHPILKDVTMLKVAEKLISGTEVFTDLIEEVQNYKTLIEAHFRKNYGIKIDYNICHFATEGIVEKLAYQKLYSEEIIEPF